MTRAVAFIAAGLSVLVAVAWWNDERRSYEDRKTEIVCYESAHARAGDIVREP